MKTRKKEIKIDDGFSAEYRGSYVFGEITWAKRNRIIQKYTKYHPRTGQVVNSDYVSIQAETIWASLKEQPENKPITLEKLLSEVNGIPIELGELLSQVVNRLCSVTVDEARFLSEPCAEEKNTLLSRNSDSAKSSGNCQARSVENQPKTSKSFS